MPGRHRSPPTPALRTGWRWHTVAALAGLGILAPPVTLWAQAVAPDATARSQVSTVTRAERTDAGPLVLPTVGASGAWTPPEVTVTENALSRPRSVPRVQGHAPAPLSASTGQPEVLTTPPQQTVTPAPQPVTTEQPADAPPTTVAAATTTSSATTTEEPTVTPTAEPTVTVDVTAEVGAP